MFYYSAYNLAIHSEICLPEFPPGKAGRHLAIRLTAAHGPLDPRPIEWRESPVPEARFSFPQVGAFLVRRGCEVVITPDLAADPTILPLYVQGMMLASALFQRGLFVLHSSVVDLDGRAIAFMGPIGAGKSTFASAFLSRGYRIVADDNAAIDLNDPELRVLPAFPSLKVYPEVARSLGHNDRLLRPMHASQIKQAQSIGRAFSPTPLPLEAVYVLDREAGPEVARISPVETVTEIIRHSVPTRWNVAGGARHLKMCVELARRVPIFRVRTFTELAEIPRIAEQIERHSESRFCAV
jgi:hypothetical protein